MRRHGTSPADAAGDLHSAYARFGALLERATTYHARGDLQSAAVHVELAAAQAYWTHAGLFVSESLEHAMGAIAREVLPETAPGGVALRRAVRVARVLHVLTQATSIGGHTRMVWRWIEEDGDRSHSIVLTRQGILAVPAELLSATSRTSGRVHVLNRRPGGIPSYARRLRAIAQDFDLVVLHTFAGDAVASIAFADPRRRPPVVLINQADHAFWVGRDSVDLVVDLRDSGAVLSQERRGVPAARLALLPIVLPAFTRSRSKEAAKHVLGLRPTDIVLLTVARGMKFRSAGGEHFLDSVMPVIRTRPNTILFAIGPANEGPWARAALETSGRVRALGEVGATAAYREAADIYLDSYPIVSTTSLLEAACYGLPVVTRCPHDGPCDVLCADSPGLRRSLLRTRNVADHEEILQRLVDGPSFRTDMGEAARVEVAALHTGEGWRRALERLYGDALHSAPAGAAGTTQDVPQATALDVLTLDLYGDAAVFGSIRDASLRALPTRVRLREWLRLSVRTKRLRPALLLPEWLYVALRRWHDHVRSAFTRRRVQRPNGLPSANTGAVSAAVAAGRGSASTGSQQCIDR